MQAYQPQSAGGQMQQVQGGYALPGQPPSYGQGPADYPDSYGQPPPYPQQAAYAGVPAPGGSGGCGGCQGGCPGYGQGSPGQYGGGAASYQFAGAPSGCGYGGATGAGNLGGGKGDMSAAHGGYQGGHMPGGSRNGMASRSAGMHGGFGGMGGDSMGQSDGYGGMDFHGGYGGMDEREYGWRQEYSMGNVPEYEQEHLWNCTEEIDEEMAEVHVFGPSGEQVPPAVASFDDASQIFPPQLVQRLQYAGFVKPTPIQAHTWAIAVAGRDLIGIAKTGSGKTLAFLLPGFLKFMQARGRPPALCIMAPTRELACQIEAEAEKFGRPCGIRTACCYGGAPRGPQLGAIRRGAQVVVACPGRLNDFLESGAVNLSTVNYLVLDEADRMLDMGFEPQIRQVINHIPPGRQTLLFTATWPREVRSLASEFLQRPIHVQTGAVDDLSVNKDIEQHVVFVSSDSDKVDRLIGILQQIDQKSRVLIFCDMKRSAEELAGILRHQYNIRAARIHGDMAQYERSTALDNFKNGHSPIMVATDVAARGLDVKGVTHVINFDACGSAKDYVHRIGRTGRAGCKGIAISLLLPTEDKKAQDIVMVLQRSNLPIPPELEPYAVQRRGPRFGKGKGKGKGWKGKGKGGKGKGGGFGNRFGGGGKGRPSGGGMDMPSMPSHGMGMSAQF